MPWMKARLLSRLTFNISRPMSSGDAMLCCTDIVSASAASLSVRAHSAALTAATGSRLRGMPGPGTTSPGSKRRVCRMFTPRTRQIFAPRGTETRTSAASNPLSPASMRAGTPSR